MATVQMLAPTGITGIITASKTGNIYTIASNGYISADSRDVNDLQNAGFTQQERTGQGAVGFGTQRIPLVNFKNSDGSVVTATPAAGKFGVTMTFGTSEALTSETANSATKTDIGISEIVLPQSYAAGQDIPLTVNAQVSGALTTKTVAADVRRLADAGTQSAANLVATAAQVMATTAGDLAFVITGATLNPGDRIGIKLTMVITEGAAANQTGQINSVRLN